MRPPHSCFLFPGLLWLWAAVAIILSCHTLVRRNVIVHLSPNHHCPAITGISSETRPVESQLLTDKV
ncbi:uncharacterized protein BDV14DRAFT_182236 [Aspergillus stella-maris]|uniref:uncharacterized protein n=1 Tax=Aspergillus stella-maris TaxID=1810926 RepID=UPI003CCE1B3B